MSGSAFATRYRWLAAIICLTVLGAAASVADAKQPLLWESCKFGAGAGKCKIPRGLATDPENGHLYVADQQNSRIVELTAWGEFVKAWGWGVDDGSAELADLHHGIRLSGRPLR